MSARPMPFAALPERIGKYLVQQVIGAGAMGVVYRALDPHIHRTVAVKTIHRSLLEGHHGQAAVQRFRLEAQAAGRLNHPNIVSIYEYGEASESELDLYIAMECVEGRSLHAITGQGTRLALPDVMAVMVQLLDALNCAHEQRVWHCDVKPSNLLVTRDGRVKVTDFGIARIDSTDLTQRGAVLGSPGYMAPERYRGEAPDQRVDLFACGVLLYELMTGVAPFGGTPQQAMAQVLHHEPAPPSALPASVALPAFDKVIARALAKRPADRFTTAVELREALLDAAPAGAVRHALSSSALVQMRRSPTGSQPVAEPPSDATTLTAQMPRSAVLAPVLPPASQPISQPASGPQPWDPRQLAQVEALLKPLLGPMSRIVVRDASRKCSGFAALVGKIAQDSLQREERAAFLAQAARIASLEAAAPPRPAPGAPPPPAEVPVLGATPLRPELVEQAARVLAQHIGPIAALHARRAAAAAVSCEQFFCALAERAGEGVDRKRLLDQLWKLA
ncbi:MAG: protein kinase [Rubrivivax sp.]